MLTIHLKNHLPTRMLSLGDQIAQTEPDGATVADALRNGADVADDGSTIGDALRQADDVAEVIESDYSEDRVRHYLKNLTCF